MSLAICSVILCLAKSKLKLYYHLRSVGHFLENVVASKYHNPTASEACYKDRLAFLLYVILCYAVLWIASVV
jgi:hypothetical protein